MKKNHSLKAIVEVIRQNKSFMLLPHVNIDGDDLGCMTALSQALQKLGKQVYLYSQDKIPEIFNFLSGLPEIQKCLPSKKVDVLIFMECSKASRAGDDLNLNKIAGTTINFDHHPDNNFFADFNLVKPEYAALGELIYELIRGLKLPIDENMATGLYTSIISDTGNLQYGNISRKTFQILADLMKLPIKVSEISRQVFRQKDFQVLKLFGQLASKLQRTSDGLIVWASLTKTMLDGSGLKPEDLQNFVEDLNQVAGSEVVILFKEVAPQEIRVNFRSRRFPVNRIAAQFGGGGHINASGCTISQDLKSTEKLILETLENQLTVLA